MSAMAATTIHPPAAGISPAFFASGTTTPRITPGRTNSASATATNSLPSRASTIRVSSHACDRDNLCMGAPDCVGCLMVALPRRRNGACSRPPGEPCARAVEIPSDIEWRESDAPVPYAEALALMEERAAAIRAGTARECVWLLEHPPLFTAGTSADPSELFNPLDLPVFQAGRGGRYTY